MNNAIAFMALFLSSAADARTSRWGQPSTGLPARLSAVEMTGHVDAIEDMGIDFDDVICVSVSGHEYCMKANSANDDSPLDVGAPSYNFSL